MVECQTSNLNMRVRFSLSAPVTNTPMVTSLSALSWFFVKNEIQFFELNLFYCWSFKMGSMFLVKLETISENLDQIKLKLSII